MRGPVVFVVVVVIILTLYGALNYYVVRRGWQALEGFRTGRLLFLAVMSALILTYPAGRAAAGLNLGGVATFFLRLGSFYMAFWIHVVLALAAIDLLRLGAGLMNIRLLRPGGSPNLRLGAFFLVAAAAAGAVAAGHLNSVRHRVHRLDVDIDKAAGGLPSLDAVMVSDVHIGVMVPAARLERIVDDIVRLRPEIVLMAGDIVDESVSAEDERRAAAVLRRIEAPLGVFAVLGNHESYVGLEENLRFLESAGVRVLRDEAVPIAGAIVLAGRMDPSAMRGGERRRSIADILAASGTDGQGRPIILLDHQPRNLAEAAAAGVDLQLSGHTHAGQIIPLTILNRLAWELSWGYRRKGATHYYVSCGVGTWGPPIRTGSVPEIVHLRIRFGAGPAAASRRSSSPGPGSH